ncbi:DUF2931 family protein [Erwinia sp. MMLR14_017]|uniref:DUF2931 family protein n=1 Tax=Erwinia sp. MMLR14_017 TaxID=3093842 RepID=UPI00298FF9B0|nr:DUF2931 family protein [Erwinia sp. MMLR14_017]MDW8847683.1 DUF2931 family protein [Erwinia sp. MMLR14_017]
MEITRVTWLILLLSLTACQDNSLSDTAVQNAVPTEWTFDFFTPKALPALVTFAVVQDADGKVYEFNTLNRTSNLPGIVGGWNDKDRASGGYWNHVKRPLRPFIFCWDSIIDKRVYETHLTITKPVLEKMLRPGEYRDYRGRTAYCDRVQIGLAPEEKVAVWLQRSGSEPNYRIIQSILKTVSGDKLDICKGVMRFSNGQEYGKETEDFIKGKKYPYGSW